MKRCLFAGLLTLLAALPAAANEPGIPGGFAPGYAAPGYGNGTAWASNGLGFINKTPTPFGCSPYGFLGLGMRMFPLIHQNGPLVNYGPYSGYYPFEPYGPWTSNLEYTGPMTAPNAWRYTPYYGATFHPLHNSLVRAGALRSYAVSTFQNVLRRINPFSGSSSGCSSCTSLNVSGQSTSLASFNGPAEPAVTPATDSTVRSVLHSVRER